MEFFDQFSDTLISTGKMVGEKAKDIADVTKLSYQIRALAQEIHEKYQELGKVLYEANEAGEELPDESDVFEVIREKKEEVDELRAQIKIIRELRSVLSAEKKSLRTQPSALIVGKK